MLQNHLDGHAPHKEGIFLSFSSCRFVHQEKQQKETSAPGCTLNIQPTLAPPAYKYLTRARSKGGRGHGENPRSQRTHPRIQPPRGDSRAPGGSAEERARHAAVRAPRGHSDGTLTRKQSNHEQMKMPTGGFQAVQEARTGDALWWQHREDQEPRRTNTLRHRRRRGLRTGEGDAPVVAASRELSQPEGAADRACN